MYWDYTGDRIPCLFLESLSSPYRLPFMTRKRHQSAVIAALFHFPRCTWELVHFLLSNQFIPLSSCLLGDSSLFRLSQRLMIGFMIATRVEEDRAKDGSIHE